MNHKKRLKRDNVNSGQLIVEVVVKEWSGYKHDKFVANQDDAKEIRRIGFILRDKYDIDFCPRKQPDFFGV